MNTHYKFGVFIFLTKKVVIKKLLTRRFWKFMMPSTI